MDSQTLAIVALVLYIVFGIIFCFFGNKWLKVILAVYGFILGFLLVNTLLPMFTSLGGLEVLLISLGAGIVIALLFVLLMYAGLFFIGFGAGVLLSLLIVDAFGLNIYEWYIYIPILIVGIILGSLTLNKRRIFVSIFTAFIGASMLSTALFSIIYGIKAETLISYGNVEAVGAMYTSTVYLIALVVLFVAGIVVQLMVTSKKKRA
jgi:hypothetical protein